MKSSPGDLSTLCLNIDFCPVTWKETFSLCFSKRVISYPLSALFENLYEHLALADIAEVKQWKHAQLSADDRSSFDFREGAVWAYDAMCKVSTATLLCYTFYMLKNWKWAIGHPIIQHPAIRIALSDIFSQSSISPTSSSTHFFLWGTSVHVMKKNI